MLQTIIINFSNVNPLVIEDVIQKTIEEKNISLKEDLLLFSSINDETGIIFLSTVITEDMVSILTKPLSLYEASVLCFENNDDIVNHNLKLFSINLPFTYYNLRTMVSEVEHPFFGYGDLDFIDFNKTEYSAYISENPFDINRNNSFKEIEEDINSISDAIGKIDNIVYKNIDNETDIFNIINTFKLRLKSENKTEFYILKNNQIYKMIDIPQFEQIPLSLNRTTPPEK